MLCYGSLIADPYRRLQSVNNQFPRFVHLLRPRMVTNIGIYIKPLWIKKLYAVEKNEIFIPDKRKA